MLVAYSVNAWIVLTVLSLVSLPAWSDFKVVQPYRVQSTNGTAQVRCLVHLQRSSDHSLPLSRSDHVAFQATLLKGLHGSQPLCSATHNLNVTAQPAAGRVQCSAKAMEGVVIVTVSGLRAADTDLYRCQVEIIFPPPYLQHTGNGTLIHVSDSLNCPVQPARQIAHHSDKEDNREGDERTSPVSIPVVVLVSMIIMVIVIIITFQALHCRHRRVIVRTVPGVLHKVDAAAFSCDVMA